MIIYCKATQIFRNHYFLHYKPEVVQFRKEKCSRSRNLDSSVMVLSLMTSSHLLRKTRGQLREVIFRMIGGRLDWTDRWRFPHHSLVTFCHPPFFLRERRVSEGPFPSHSTAHAYFVKKAGPIFLQFRTLFLSFPAPNHSRKRKKRERTGLSPFFWWRPLLFFCKVNFPHTPK